MKQICYNELDKPYLCGYESKKYLEKELNVRFIVITLAEIDIKG